MTPNQLRIAEWLEHEVPTLYPAYVQVVQLMAGPDFPGRSNQVCHPCRDICTVIQQYYRVEKTVRAGTTKLLNELDVLWSQRLAREPAPKTTRRPIFPGQSTTALT